MTSYKNLGAAAVAALALLAFAPPAGAVSEAVKRACANDYFAHCSMHAVGTPGVRKCMRAVGPRLSKPCLAALGANGHITTADRKRYKKVKSASR